MLVWGLGLPLLAWHRYLTYGSVYVLGMQQADDAIAFPVEGMDGGSISMLCVRVG